MNKPELQLLGKVWEAEVNAALSSNGIHVFQTKSKVAEKLAQEGLIELATVNFKGVKILGYQLTHLGRFTYCSLS